MYETLEAGTAQNTPHPLSPASWRINIIIIYLS